MTETKVIEAKKVTEAIKLTNALAPDLKEQFEGKRSIHIEIDPKQTDKEKRIVVNFSGFWDGRGIQIALREIRRAYFYRRNKQLSNAHK